MTSSSPAPLLNWTWSEPAALALALGGCLLMVGLLLGVWKYLAIRRHPQAVAPEYVSIAHRAALMYAYATGLLALLCQRNALPASTQVLCVCAMVGSFAFAIASYVVHGALRDTDNQFRKPLKLGQRTVHDGWADASMLVKGSVELAALGALIWGFMQAQWPA